MSIVDRGSIFVEMAVPSLRALEGRLLRKSRTDLDLAEKGLTLVETSVMKRVIIFLFLNLDGASRPGRGRGHREGEGSCVILGLRGSRIEMYVSSRDGGVGVLVFFVVWVYR